MNHPGDGPLNEYVDGLLDRRAADRVAVHLEGCGPCRERVATIRVLNDRLAALPRTIAPRRDLGAGIRRRVAKATSPAPERPTAYTDAGGRDWLRAAAVVLAVAGTGTALWLGHQGGAADAGAPGPLIDSYASAADDLARAMEDRKAALGPAGARAFAESLASVEAAIRELERAHRRGGPDPDLLRQLEARHRARLELLRGAAVLLEES